MEKKYDLLALGEVMLRLSPVENARIVESETFIKQTGGAELNVAAGAATLGLRTGMIAKLPKNALGSYVRNDVRRHGVSDAYLTYDEEKNARLGVYYYEGGAYPRKPGIVYDRRDSSATKITVEDYDEELYRSTRCFHTTGITLALGGACRQTAIEMMKRFKEQGVLISFDVNFRGNLWTGEEARECIESILPYVDIFFCSEDTARLTFHKTGNVREIMKSFTKEYPISIVASTQRIVHSPKRHTFGSVIYESRTDTYYEEEPYRDIEVIDRIGSGDAYIAGMLYGYLKYGDCQRALEYGGAVGAAKNTTVGDISSLDEGEIAAIIRDHGQQGGGLEMAR